MSDTGDKSIADKLGDAQKWASEVAGDAWQPIKDNPWTAGLVTVGAVGLGYALRVPIARLFSGGSLLAEGTQAAARLGELAPIRGLAPSDATVQATSLNIQRTSLLQDMDRRARTPIDTYIKWLGDQTKLHEVDAATLMGKHEGHQIVIRKDLAWSMRRRADALELVDHETQTARLYTNDYGSMRTTIYPTDRAPGIRPNSPSYARVSGEFLTDGGSEKAGYIRNWFYKSAEGKSMVRQLNSL